jgi:hypothetical protein
MKMLKVAARRHWLIGLLTLAGLALRVMAALAYRPALIYIDSLKYLYNSWPGSDPVGYKIPLDAIDFIGNLDLVVAVQHLLGLAMGIVIYLLLVRRGTPGWLAALGAAPVLLDAYELQMEQMVMPDVWFEALIVAGIAVLAWHLRPGLAAIAAAGLMLGASATMRQVGEVMVVPAVIYLVAVARRGDWLRLLGRCAALCLAFAVPIVAYMAAADAITGHFQLSHSGANSTYGRLADAADCATLALPAAIRPLCPTPAQQAKGADWLDHEPGSPIRQYQPPPGLGNGRAVAEFDNAVLRQQPLRVARAILGDAAKLFAVDRVAAPGDTPISRWQFQDAYPVYPTYTSLSRSGTIIAYVHPKLVGGPVVPTPVGPGLGGNARVIRPLAVALRAYQLHGGYTPGPALVVAVIAGLIGSVAWFRRRKPDPERLLTSACLLFFTSAVAILLVSDLFEYSWRYQLPAVITLPPAGALGIALISRWLRAGGRRDGAGMQDVSGPVASGELRASHDAGTR